MKAPEQVETARLVLRRPRAADASDIFDRYARDPVVTRYLSWPTHVSLEETRAFLAFSEGAWARWPAGAYLICAREDGAILGSTGLSFETRLRAATGYVLARDAWGRGYATEALAALVGIARAVGLRRLEALCHVDHQSSWRVLEKCGFEREGRLRRHSVFPNLDEPGPCDVWCYATTFD
ncbi:MAG: GNAT family N-acetyltransferase [Gemmatimonadetes bacterium]|nr:GNAT family N-acetyltransferase [Gemmatimonadota bacterium]